jgi:hypothetical protein
MSSLATIVYRNHPNANPPPRPARGERNQRRWPPAVSCTVDSHADPRAAFLDDEGSLKKQPPRRLDALTAAIGRATSREHARALGTGRCPGTRSRGAAWNAAPVPMDL